MCVSFPTLASLFVLLPHFEWGLKSKVCSCGPPITRMTVLISLGSRLQHKTSDRGFSHCPPCLLCLWHATCSSLCVSSVCLSVLHYSFSHFLFFFCYLFVCMCVWSPGFTLRHCCVAAFYHSSSSKSRAIRGSAHPGVNGWSKLVRSTQNKPQRLKKKKTKFQTVTNSGHISALVAQPFVCRSILLRCHICLLASSKYTDSAIMSDISS